MEIRKEFINLNEVAYLIRFVSYLPIVNDSLLILMIHPEIGLLHEYINKITLPRHHYYGYYTKYLNDWCVKRREISGG